MNVTDAQSEAVKRSITVTQPEIEGTGNLFMMLWIVSLVRQQKRATIYTALQKKSFTPLLHFVTATNFKVSSWMLPTKYYITNHITGVMLRAFTFK